MKKILSQKGFKQFLSYFIVGGTAAIVEWIIFSILSNALYINYMIATSIAFIFSTTVNWILGRLLTFKSSKAFVQRRIKEAILVFLVSFIGLLFNILLMYIMVDVLQMSGPLQKILSKIIATGIVFVWNFMLRKYFIYKT